MQGQERKDQILQVAAGVFAEYGYEQTSIAKICEASGIGRGTLYQYFDDKKSLFRELIERYAQRLQALAETITLDEAHPEEEWENLYEKHLALIKEIFASKELYAVFAHEGVAKNADVEDLVRGMQTKMIEVVRHNLARGAELGNYELPDPEFTAVYFVGGFIKALEWYMFESKSSCNPEELARKVTDLQFRCLGLRPSMD